MYAWGKKARRGFLRRGMEVFPASEGWTMFSHVIIIHDASAKLLLFSIHKKEEEEKIKYIFQDQDKKSLYMQTCTK